MKNRRIDFYHIDAMEAPNYEPIWSALKRLGADPRMITIPGDENAAAEGWFDFDRVASYYHDRGIPYDTHTTYRSPAVTTQNEDILQKYNSPHIRLMYGPGIFPDSWGLSEQACSPFDAVLVHGPYYRELLSQWKNPEDLIIIGYPKYDSFFKQTINKSFSAKKWNIDPDLPTISYIPTWQNNSTIEVFLHSICALQKNFNVIIKPHHCTLRMEQARMKAIKKSGIIIADSAYDLPGLIYISDIVLSDVRSAAYSEALMTGRSTIGVSIHPDDDQKWMSEAGALEMSPFISNPSLLQIEIEKTLEKDPFLDQREEWINKHVSFRDGTASETAAERILEWLEKHENRNRILFQPAKVHPQKQNVVWLILDGLRPDKLYSCGNQKQPELSLDRLLSRGSLFTNMFTSQGCSKTSLHAAFTAMVGASNGVNGYSYDNLRNLDPHALSITDHLKRLGYTTYRYCDKSHPECTATPKSGFDVWEHSGFYELRNTPEYSFSVPARQEFIREFNETTDPKFAFIHLLLLHDLAGDAGGYNWTSEMYENFINNQGEDALALLDDLNLGPNDLLIISADHGVTLDCNRLEDTKANGVRLDDAHMRVFCSFIHKDIPPQKHDRVVRTIDIAPTILDLISGEDMGSQGTSLLPLIKGEDMAELEAYLARDSAYEDPPWIDSPCTWGIRTDRWKYVMHKWREENEWLIDYEQHPDYTENLIETGLEIEAELRKKVHRVLIDNPLKPREIYKQKGLEFSRNAIQPEVTAIYIADCPVPDHEEAIAAALDQIGPYTRLIILDLLQSHELEELYGSKKYKDHPFIQFITGITNEPSGILEKVFQEIDTPHIAVIQSGAVLTEDAIYNLRRHLTLNQNSDVAVGDYQYEDKGLEDLQYYFVDPSLHDRKSSTFQHYPVVMIRREALQNTLEFTNNPSSNYGIWDNLLDKADISGIQHLTASWRQIEPTMLNDLSSKPDAPRVSVILPTYNHLRFLPDALDNLLNQTYKDFEVVIVNDGSTDGTREFLDRIKHPQIRIIHQENRRLPGALNTGFRAAQGELLTWVSTDNHAAPFFLEALVGALDAHPSAGFAYSSFAMMNAESQITGFTRDQIMNRENVIVKNPGIAAFMYRRSVMNTVGLYDTQLEGAEDWDMWIRILDKFDAVYIPEILYYYRQHNDSMTGKMLEKILKASHRTFQKTIRRNGLSSDHLFPVLDRCVDRNRCELSAWFNLGVNLLKCDFIDRKTVCQVFERALHLAPDTPETAYNLIIAYGQAGEWNKAIHLISQIKKIKNKRIQLLAEGVRTAFKSNQPSLLRSIRPFELDPNADPYLNMTRSQVPVYRYTVDLEDPSLRISSRSDYEMEPEDISGTDSRFNRIQDGSKKPAGIHGTENSAKKTTITQSQKYSSQTSSELSSALPNGEKDSRNNDERSAGLTILHLNDNDLTGGATKVALMLAEAQERMGHSPELLVGRKLSSSRRSFSFPVDIDQVIQEKCDEDGFLYYEFQGSHHLASNEHIRNADIVHLHNIHGSYFNPYSISSLSHLKPILWTLHDMQSITGHCAHSFDCNKWQTGCGNCPYLEVYPALNNDSTAELWSNKKDIYGHSFLHIASPSYWLREKIDESILNHFPVDVIPNGVNTKIFHPHEKTSARKEFGIPSSCIAIGGVAYQGTLANPWKGGEYALSALKILREKLPNAIYVNIGTNEPSNNPYVVNIPHIEDEHKLAKAYSALDIFFYTPKADNCPLVILEALACGVPIVSFNTGGISELVRNEIDGLITPYLNVELIAEQVIRLAKDADKRKLFSKNARAHAVNNFDHDTITAPRYEELYHHVLSEFRSSGSGPKLFIPVHVPEIIQTQDFIQAELSKLDTSNQPPQGLDHVSKWTLPDKEVSDSILISTLNQITETEDSKIVDKNYNITAIVSTYNSAELLPACLDDLENQTIADQLEIIVIDSGSEENEEDIVRDYQKRYENIRYIRTERESLYQAWNRGVLMAKGKYITNANTDDAHHPEALEKLVHALETTPSADLAYADCFWTSEPGGSFEKLPQIIREVRNPPYQPALNMLYCPLGPHPVWRREVFEKVGLFDARLNIVGDYEFLIRFTALRLEAVQIQETLSLFYQNPEGLSFKNNKALLELQKINDRYRQSMPIHSIFNVPSNSRTDLAKAWAALGNQAVKYDVPWLDTPYSDPSYALYCYTKSIEFEPNMPAVHNLATIFGATGNWNQCEKLIQKFGGLISPELRKAVSEQRTIQLIPIRMQPSIKPLIYSARQGRTTSPDNEIREIHHNDIHNFGFNIIGYISGNLGVGIAARNMVKILVDKNVPFQILDLDPGNDRYEYDLSFKDYVVRRPEDMMFPVNLFILPAGDLVLFLNKYGSRLSLPKRLNAALSMWELTKIPEDWVPTMEKMDVMVAGSSFIYHTFSFNLSGVRTIHGDHPISLPDGVSSKREKFGIPEDAFVLISSFDAFSDPERKNPLAVVNAFEEAFSTTDNARLILKISNAEQGPTLHSIVMELRDRAQVNPNITLINTHLKYREVLDLYASSDAFVSLHRAEGLGLGLMEAMALGKPVIATGWSGNMSFMDHTNACLVGYNLIPVDGTILAYSRERLGEGAVWADPDIAEAAAWMKRLYRNPGLGKEIGKRAKDSISAHNQKAEAGSFIQEIESIWEHRKQSTALNSSSYTHHPDGLLKKAEVDNWNVDIVIPIYGQPALLKRCVEGILNSTENAHIILVDDQSPGSEIEKLFAGWKGNPRITLARTTQNSGFIGATRLGADLGKAPFILFLNSDTAAIEPGWLEELIPVEEDIAVVGAKLLHPPDAPAPLSGTIQHAGVARNDRGIPYHPFLGRSADLAEANESREVNAVTGACFLVRRSIWEDLNGWNPIFKRGVYEDVDFCWRVREKGLRIRYEPGACLYHHGSASESLDGHHSLNEHLSENLSRLLQIWPDQASDENLFFEEKMIIAHHRAASLTEKAKRQISEGNMKAALQTMRNAIRTAPDYPAALIGYAQLLTQQKKFNKAADQLRSALDIAPTNWSARVMLIDTLLSNQEAQSAWEHIRMMELHFPGNAEIVERRQRALTQDPSLAKLEKSARVEQLFNDLLNANDMPAMLEKRSGEFDQDLLDLVYDFIKEAEEQENEEVASGMRNLAVYLEDCMAGNRDPLLETSPEQLLDFILNAEDTERALKLAEPQFNDAFLTHLDYLSTSPDLADSQALVFRELSIYVRDVLASKDPPDDLARAEAFLEEILIAPDILPALEENQHELTSAFLQVVKDNIRGAEEQGLYEVASAMRHLQTYVEMKLSSIRQD